MTDKIAHAEITDIFGDTMPLVAAQLLQTWRGTADALRTKLKAIARERAKQREIALAAAAQASDATAELVRFAHEGDSHPPPFGETEVVLLLADALKLAMDVEHFDDPDLLAIDDERNQLYGALSKFIEGWAG